MKRLSIFLLLLLPLLLQAQQLTMRDVLLTMPDTLMPYLSQENRLDLLDFQEAKMKAEVNNELQGKTVLTSMGTDSLTLQMNDSHQLTLYLFEAETEIDSSRQVIVVSRTFLLSTGEQEHSVRFYSHRWSLLSNSPRLSPELLSRLKPEGSTLLRRDEEILLKGKDIL